MTWKDETSFERVEDLFLRLHAMWKKNALVACRGQADSRWALRTSLDRILAPQTDYVSRLAEELALIEKFRVLASEYLGRNECNYLGGIHSNDKISALAGLQHYGAPTRVLDWTASPFVALYYAAIGHHDRAAAVWWFRIEDFENEVHRRWDNRYHLNRNGPMKEVDLNETAFRTDGPPWITNLFYPVPFHRIKSQQGFFTVAGQLGLDHGDLIDDVFTNGQLDRIDGQYGRIIVRASWKQEILDRLRNMNIHSRSLDYPGADLVGIELKRKLEVSLNPPFLLPH